MIEKEVVTTTEQSSYVEATLIWKQTIEYRQYQKNISESACGKNTLVILPTALGKTVIAVLVCADMLYNYKEKRVLMMAPTRPLVSQHLKSFSAALKIPKEQIALVTGKTVPEARRAVWDKKDVVRLVFATPEVVRNDLEEGRLHLKDFSLLVFDEAHRAVKDYAYTAIAREYAGQSLHPVILALTASPGADRQRIQEVCDNLFIEHVEYRSEEDSDVKPYVNLIEVKWEWFDLPKEYQYISSILRSALDERLKWLIQRGILGKKKDTRWIFKRDLIEAGEALRYRLELTMEEQRGPIYVAIINQSAALTLMYCLELVESQGTYSLKAFLERIEQDGRKAHSSLLKDPRMIEIKTIVDSTEKEHPKNQRILELVKDIHPQQGSSDMPGKSSSTQTEFNSSKILIFTQYRDTARHIVDILSRNGARTSRFVGQAKRQGDEGMKQDEQAAILQSFRDGEFDVLVATSIAEEGLDIPEVDLVVFYEPIPSEIRYIQRRGRTGRKSAGSVIILAAKDTIDTRHLYASKRRVEKMRESLSSINAVLKPMNRTFLELEPNPMTPEELSALDAVQGKEEEKLRRVAEAELRKEKEGEEGKPILSQDIESRVRQLQEDERHRETLSLESETLTGAFKREVGRAARHIQTELAKAGRKGADVDLLREYLSLDYPVLNEALKMLEKMKILVWVNESRIILPESLERATGDTYSVEVEKVVQGKAVVVIDKKWHARLNYYDYDGPRDLLKKGSKFTVVGELYRQEEGVLNLKVKRIV